MLQAKIIPFGSLKNVSICGLNFAVGRKQPAILNLSGPSVGEGERGSTGKEIEDKHLR